MTFTTLTFLLFLPVVFGLYWSKRSLRWRNAVVVSASYFFYGWWDPRYAVLMLVASLVDFSAGIALDAVDSPRLRRLILIGSCVCSLGLLGFFKYAGFFAENARVLAGLAGLRLTEVELHVVLPVGISFYTFQTLSYVIDVYRRRSPATRNLLEYMAYVSFFPQLVAGPIERAGHLLPQFQSLRSFDRGQAVDGLRLMAWGFFKKMALADNLGVIADDGYGMSGPPTGPRWPWRRSASRSRSTATSRPTPTSQRGRPGCSASSSCGTSPCPTSRRAWPSSGGDGTSRCRAGSPTMSTSRWGAAASGR